MRNNRQAKVLERGVLQNCAPVFKAGIKITGEKMIRMTVAEHIWGCKHQTFSYTFDGWHRSGVGCGVAFFIALQNRPGSLLLRVRLAQL